MVVRTCHLSTQEVQAGDHELGARVCCYTGRLSKNKTKKEQKEGADNRIAERAVTFPRGEELEGQAESSEQGLSQETLCGRAHLPGPTTASLAL